MPNTIVQINVSVTSAPAPSTLLSTGALVCQGATTLTAGTRGLLTQLSDLTPMLVGVVAFTALSWTGGTASGTLATPHGLTAGDTLKIVVSGVTPAGYNGTYNATASGTNVLTFPIASNPGTASVLGGYTPEDVGELMAMATTFFAQGKGVSVYVLELGLGGGVDGVTALATWITNNPATVFSYLVPRYFAGANGFLALVLSYNAPNSLTKFFVTAALTGVNSYNQFTSLMSNAFVMVEAPGIPATEFSCAAPFAVTLANAPSSANKITPLAYSYAYGVTPYPTVGNSAQLQTLLTASVNYIGTGAEGGVTTAIIRNGTMMDGNPFNYGYAISWAVINLDLALANAVINGSNNPQAPLYYNQAGISTLQAVAQNTLTNGVTFGLFLGPVIVTAVSFHTYAQQNPGDYAIGRYAGLASQVSAQNGFIDIVFNLNVTNFVNPGA